MHRRLLEIQFSSSLTERMEKLSVFYIDMEHSILINTTSLLIHLKYLSSENIQRRFVTYSYIYTSRFIKLPHFLRSLYCHSSCLRCYSLEPGINVGNIK